MFFFGDTLCSNLESKRGHNDASLSTNILYSVGETSKVVLEKSYFVCNADIPRQGNHLRSQQ